jgi:hypothetical protein
VIFFPLHGYARPFPDPTLDVSPAANPPSGLNFNPAQPELNEHFSNHEPQQRARKASIID